MNALGGSDLALASQGFVTLTCSPFPTGRRLAGPGPDRLPFSAGPGPLSRHLLSPHYRLGLGKPPGRQGAPESGRGFPSALPLEDSKPAPEGVSSLRFERGLLSSSSVNTPQSGGSRGQWPGRLRLWLPRARPFSPGQIRAQAGPCAAGRGAGEGSGSHKAGRGRRFRTGSWGARALNSAL